MKMRWSFALLLLIVALPGCQKSPREAEVSGEAQGTTYHIKLVLDHTSASLEEIRRQISATLAEIDVQLSNYREDSEISRINRLERTTWLPVSQEIAELLVIAHTVYERSDGCYDPTVEPLFDLWGFSRHENRVPTQNEIDALLPHMGMSLLEVDAVNLRIRKKDPKLKIDLSSIAQGYSVGVVARNLEALGIRNYLVEIGGEMMVKGRKANGNDWRVAVQTPTPLTQDIQKIIDVREQGGTAIMTAGTYQNFFEDNGQTYGWLWGIAIPLALTLIDWPFRAILTGSRPTAEIHPIRLQQAYVEVFAPIGNGLSGKHHDALDATAFQFLQHFACTRP
jgi:thiamine biosynthesis lipoprotein